MGTAFVSIHQNSVAGHPTHLNSFSSSITCIPCSYCSLVGASPTFAKWLFPFIVMMEGAVGNLEAAAEGRRFGEEESMIEFKDSGVVKPGAVSPDK